MTKHDLSRFHPPRKLTKKARKDAVRAIIDRNDYLVPFDGEDTNAFNDLTGADFAFIRREANPIYPSDTRYITTSDCGLEWTGWSWNKAIDGWVDHSPSLVSRAFRIAIADQIALYRASAAKECAECGCLHSLTVDHYIPSFKAMVTHFVDMHGHIELANGPHGIGRVIADPAIEQAWRNFHEEHATYQILCRSCNSRKGSK